MRWLLYQDTIFNILSETIASILWVFMGIVLDICIKPFTKITWCFVLFNIYVLLFYCFPEAFCDCIIQGSTFTAQCAVRADEAQIVAPKPMEKPGTSTVQIMKDLEYNDMKIRKLIEDEAISVSWGKDYFPIKFFMSFYSNAPTVPIVGTLAVS